MYYICIIDGVKGWYLVLRFVLFLVTVMNCSLWGGMSPLSVRSFNSSHLAVIVNYFQCYLYFEK